MNPCIKNILRIPILLLLITFTGCNSIDHHDAPIKHETSSKTGEENNQPIRKKGAMVLNCNNDLKTGPRHVNWLKSIEVYRVD